MVRTIRHFGAIGCGLALVAQSAVFAQQAQKTEFNPVENASFHQLIFSDEDIVVLNNLYPPKGDSGFHAHFFDLVGVVIQSSRSSGQSLGKPLTAAPVLLTGAILYSPVGTAPRIHRVVNEGESPYQIIVVQLQRAAPFGTAVSSRDSAPQYETILDNPRLRAWRLVLGPGQSVPAISQGNKGVRVVVRGGLLTTLTPGLQDQQLALRPGDFAIQPSGTTRALKNGGDETIELVEIEFK